MGEPTIASVRDGGGDAGEAPRDARGDTEREGDAREPELEIDGEIQASPLAHDARAAAAFDTRFAIHVTRDDGPVAGTTVTMRSSGGAVALREEGGSFVGSQRGYFQSYVLDVVGPGFERRGITLEGPAFHTFVAPAEAARHPAGAPLTVSWSPAGADGATLEAGEFPETPMADTGTSIVPGDALRADPGQTRETEVRVRRRRVARVQDGSSSSVRIEVRNEVGILVVGP